MNMGVADSAGIESARKRKELPGKLHFPGNSSANSSRQLNARYRLEDLSVH